VAELETFYKDHSDQARQHEAQRERMTNLVLAITGVLVGLVTFSKLALWALPAALTVSALGIFGYCFAGKHYERYRYHASIMQAARDEMDRLAAAPGTTPRPLSAIRSEGETKHYQKFTWPRLRGTGNPLQAQAKSWIARQRLHVFWEAVHILVAVIGVALSVAIGVKAVSGSPEEPLKVRIVGETKE
jgi:hypothetical protein